VITVNSVKKRNHAVVSFLPIVLLHTVVSAIGIILSSVCVSVTVCSVALRLEKFKVVLSCS